MSGTTPETAGPVYPALLRAKSPASEVPDVPPRSPWSWRWRPQAPYLAGRT